MKRINLIYNHIIIMIIAVLAISFFLAISGCSGVNWDDAMDKYHEMRIETEYLKKEFYYNFQINDSLIKKNNDLSSLINKYNYDIKEIKKCLDPNYNSNFDTTLIMFEIRSKVNIKNLYDSMNYKQKEMYSNIEEWDRIKIVYDSINYENSTLKSLINNLKAGRDSLNIEINLKKNILIKCETMIYEAVGINKIEIEEFRKQFELCEKKMISREGTRIERNKEYLEIGKSKIVCMSDFRERFKAMGKML